MKIIMKKDTSQNHMIDLGRRIDDLIMFNQKTASTPKTALIGDLQTPGIVGLAQLMRMFFLIP